MASVACEAAGLGQGDAMPVLLAARWRVRLTRWACCDAGTIMCMAQAKSLLLHLKLGRLGPCPLGRVPT